MITEHPSLEELSELADGDLAPDVAADVERHIGTCAACRAKLERLRTLLERAAGLPRTIDPPPGAWRVIRGRLRDHSRAVALRPRHWARTWRLRGARAWGLRAAAAVLLVASSSAITVLVLRTWQPTDVEIGSQLMPGPPAAIPAALAAVEQSYAQVVDELTLTLQAQRSELSPATIATLERTLRVIDEAIAEARAALAADPANDTLLEVLSANYEQKVQLLRRASELPART
jgi:Putative zinc-finger